jgi:SAM-dependent methyltransferase
VLQHNQTHAHVQDHYRNLAREYGSRANRTCEKTYLRLVRRFLGGRHRVLELGSGSTDLVGQLGSPLAVACDLSWDMLRMRAPTTGTQCLVAAGEKLPLRDACFDGLFLINVLEHVAECARVLEENGLWLAVTPNGNWEFWLDLAERWSLKIPEGPHVFLTQERLRQAAQEWFEVLDHRTFLVLPVGPSGLARLVDRLTCCAAFGCGFFQYIVGRKKRS